MANVIIKKRYTDLAYYDVQKSAGFPKKRDDLMARYGNEVTEAARLTNIPLVVFQGIILIENVDLEPTYINPRGYIGLGQINPATASDLIIREYKKKRLSNDEITALRRTLGARLDVLFKSDIDPKTPGNQKVGLGFSIVTQKDLLNVGFNLLVSAMYASQIMDEEIESTSEGDLLRLDRVVVRYNVGYYYKMSEGTTDALIAKLPNETRNYIKKMVGARGMMETLS